MIGQKRLFRELQRQLFSGQLANFLILVGKRGSEQEELIQQLQFPMLVQLTDIKAEIIRGLVLDSYKYKNTTFLIPFADSMSTAAKDALLKIVEECPNNNRYIMLVADINNVLPTLRSRAQIEYVDPYSLVQKLEYVPDLSSEEQEIVTRVCSNIGDIDLLRSYGITDFWNYAVLVVDNVCEVSIANALKIGDKLAFKKEEDKYDLELFAQALDAVIMQRIIDLVDTELSFSKLLSFHVVTRDLLTNLRITGINRQALFDTWILDMRSVVDGYTDA